MPASTISGGNAISGLDQQSLDALLQKMSSGSKTTSSQKGTGGMGGTTISGGISFAGLGSDGVDFASMITQLKSIEELPKKRLEAWKADWQVRYEAFDTMYTKMQELQNKLQAMTLNDLLQKKVSSSKSEVATAKASADAIDGSHKINVKQMATNTVVSSNVLVATKETKITPVKTINKVDGTTVEEDLPGTLAFTYKGKEYSYDIAAGTTLEGLVNLINKNTENPGVTASLIKSGDGYLFQLQGNDTGAANALSIDGGKTSLRLFENSSFTSGALPQGAPGDDPKDIIIAPGGTAVKFTIYHGRDAEGKLLGRVLTLGGTKDEHGVDIPCTLQDLIDEINNNTAGLDVLDGLKASIVTDTDGSKKLQILSTNGTPISFQSGNYGDDGTGNPAGGTDPLQNVGDAFDDDKVKIATGSGWTTRKAQDAVFTVDNIPRELTSASNELKEVFPGLTVTIEGEGETSLSTTTSTDELKTKIEEWVENVNGLLGQINELTKVDTKKTLVDRTETDANGNLVNKYASQFDSQFGSPLSGNYGVQLITSNLKSMLTQRSPGFRPLNSANDPSGDIFTNLLSIGITYDSNESSATFGQLRFLTDDETQGSYVVEGKTDENGKEITEKAKVYNTLNEAIEKDPVAVAKLLLGVEGTSDSPGISVNSFLKDMTKPGVYDVSYAVTNGVISDVFINGVKAEKQDTAGNVYSVASSNAQGLSITIDDLSEGAHTGTVRIKQGKINQLTEFFTDELRQGIQGDASTPRGGLVILKEHYQEIMKNIDDKISKETERITLWEKRQKARFARLDALLGRYNNQLSANASAFAQLENND